MPAPLPPRPSLEWLRKTAKARLRALRDADPRARLADAQRAVARDHGYSSWRALKAHVESVRAADPAPDPPEIARLLELVAAGRLDEVRAMVTVRPGLVNATGPHPYWGGRPQPLHVAVERGRPEMVGLLLDLGAAVDGDNRDYDGWSPLMIALSRHPALAEGLTARGARVGLAEALLAGDDHRVDALLEDRRLPPDVPGGGSWLAFARTPHAVDALLALGARPDQPDRWGATPLDALSRLGERGAALVARLAAHGTPATPEALARLGDLAGLEGVASGDPHAVTRDAVLVAAVDAGRLPVVDWLLARGASANARSGPPSRHTALHAAAWKGDLAMARRLVEKGADPAARDAEHDGTPRDWAEAAVEITGNPRCGDVAAYLASLDAGAREG